MVQNGKRFNTWLCMSEKDCYGGRKRRMAMARESRLYSQCHPLASSTSKLTTSDAHASIQTNIHLSNCHTSLHVFACVLCLPRFNHANRSRQLVSSGCASLTRIRGFQNFSSPSLRYDYTGNCHSTSEVRKKPRADLEGSTDMLMASVNFISENGIKLWDVGTGVCLTDPS